MRQQCNLWLTFMAVSAKNSGPSGINNTAAEETNWFGSSGPSKCIISLRWKSKRPTLPQIRPSASSLATITAAIAVLSSRIIFRAAATETPSLPTIWWYRAAYSSYFSLSSGLKISTCWSRSMRKPSRSIFSAIRSRAPIKTGVAIPSSITAWTAKSTSSFSPSA